MPNNLSRRQLLKGLGIAGAGITLANVDKVYAGTNDDTAAGEVPRKYWWVKTVNKPTTEIDWQQMERFKEWKTTRGSLTQYRKERYGSDDENARLNQLGKDNVLKWETDGKPGYTTKDMALKNATGFGRPDFSFMGPQKASTPEKRGVAKYVGTPEENSRVVRAALRHMGAGTVGFVELDPETTRKLIYGEEPSPGKKKIVFENVEVGYETEDKLVIPDKARWAIVYTVQMSNELMKFGPTALGSMTTGLTYTRMWTIYSQLHEFIRSLGYNSYGASGFNGFGIYPAFGVLAGLGEMSRTNRMITPEYGINVRCVALATDLPLEATKPIDFGVMDFCKECKTCAEACPSGALSMDKEPTWEPKGEWNNSGHKAYFEDSVACRNYWTEVGTNCGICFTVCPYAQDDEASLHAIIKPTIATTTVFNGIFAAADRAAYPYTQGEPLKDPESFWKNQNLAEMGIDTRRGKRNI